MSWVIMIHTATRALDRQALHGRTQ